jgi:gamma-glutamyl:cysteine ligase YbdK (ATP-grasp superfamily)
VEAEVEFGPIAWSNELVLHVIELKTNGPSPRLNGLAQHFQENVRRVDKELEAFGARVMPTGMHPWMDPAHEARLWPHEYGDVYRTFDRIFGCKGHGWSNLQSTHINLPFAGDEEFGRLHAAIRVILPLIPALSASTPVCGGLRGESLDTRLDFYRKNSSRVPSVAGRVVPEAIFTGAEYDAMLERVYADLAPLDPDKVLRHPWVNARGCIARFDRGSVEIRVIDSQESAPADLAVSMAVTAAVRGLTEGRLSDSVTQRAWSEEDLAAIFRDVIRDGDDTVIRSAKYLRTLGYPETGPASAGDVWKHLVERTLPDHPAELTLILRDGCLAGRILQALDDPAHGDPVPPTALRKVYGELADCLRDGRVFTL